MRKVCSMVLMIALLIVSSAPMFPAAAKACALDSDATHMHATHHHSIRLNFDLQTCRIECGCGMHRDVDSLPHLLAPHAISLADFDISLVMMDVAVVDIPVLKPRLLPFPVPPPRIS